MAREYNRLDPATVRAQKSPAKLHDGGGLYFVLDKSGKRGWYFRYVSPVKRRPDNPKKGVDRWHSIGPLRDVSLKVAREKARECRDMVRDGVDPIEHARAKKAARIAEAANARTFREAAKEYIEDQESDWNNLKHAKQWRSTLETYVYPVFGDLPVSAINVAMVLKVLRPIWNTKRETASRVRQRIEAVLNAAKVQGYRTGDNPAQWKGNLESILPTHGKRSKGHFAALPYRDIHDFVVSLRAQEGIATTALEFTILTAARTGETIGAQWSEIDLTQKVWTIPESRMKADKEHRVPLSPRAVEILEAMKEIRQSEYVFPGGRPKSKLSNMAMLSVLRRMGHDGITVHGFRSSFRDWAAECTSYPREVAEAALAHTIPDAVEAAYRRGDLFQKRARLMSEWSSFIEAARTSGVVIGIGVGEV